MNYKLVVTDMDGTFLDDASQIPQQNLEAVRRLRALGIHFSPVTGRGTPGLLQFQPLLQQKELCVTYNGCMVVDPVTRAIRYHLTLTDADARRAAALAKELGANLIIWSGDRPYALEDNEAVASYEVYAGMPIAITDSVEPLLQQGVTRFLLYDGSIAHADAWVAALNAHAAEFESVCVLDDHGFVDIFNSNVSKGTAVAALAKAYGIAREEILALGDGNNDIPMLQYAGLGIAMANADPQVQKYADYVTLSNSENGFAAALERFIFSRL